jgi:hypothetical protein
MPPKLVRVSKVKEYIKSFSATVSFEENCFFDALQAVQIKDMIFSEVLEYKSQEEKKAASLTLWGGRKKKRKKKKMCKCCWTNYFDAILKLWLNHRKVGALAPAPHHCTVATVKF